MSAIHSTTPVTPSTVRERGINLSRGPALALGTVLLVAGLYFLYKLHSFPRLSRFPSGHEQIGGHAFFGIFGVNGWSGELTAAVGGLLLFGAAQHILAKAVSLIVGVALGFVAVFALVNHHSVLGLFAANIWTIVLWGGSAALLLVNSLLPRAGVTTEIVVPQESVRASREAVVAPREPGAARKRVNPPQPVPAQTAPPRFGETSELPALGQPEETTETTEMPTTVSPTTAASTAPTESFGPPVRLTRPEES